ncbi:sigma-E processing peptidase SpoIIGA [Porcipelethomonas sp.]|uniref:sigma-E processing peptidase SpoIIGA n=1 Tax=Porcipelethomonas sp. TaxID=2981675 RepID=UPI003EF25E9C
MKSIYLDVLIVLNIYVNFFLLRATARFTHTPLKTSRCVVSAVIGSVFSLTILLPLSNFFAVLAIKLIAAAVIVAAAFGIADKRQTLKLILYFYIVNFVFAGVIMVLYLTFKPSFMAFNNSYFYVDFSLISLVVFTAVGYFAVTAVRYFMDKGCDTSHHFKVIIRYQSDIFSVDALADTGNSLVDSFSGKPVIICPSESFKRFEEVYDEITAENAVNLYENYGIRLIPYSTIGNSGLIAVFSPDEIIITDEETGKKFKAEALIGINPKDTPAIFNPKILC